MHKCSSVSSIVLCTSLTMAGLTACDVKNNTNPIQVHTIETLNLPPLGEKNEAVKVTLPPPHAQVSERHESH